MDHLSRLIVLVVALQVSLASAKEESITSPFSPTAALLRHWRRTFPNEAIPSSLLSKASPLTAAQAASYTAYIDSHSLHAHIAPFCVAANLYCSFLKQISIPLLDSAAKDVRGTTFADYNNKDFANYTTPSGAFTNSDFTNYSVGGNIGKDSFKAYGGERDAGSQNFLRYESDGNVGAAKFGTYQTDGIGRFENYGSNGNVGHQNFVNYADESNGGLETFQSYNEKSNVVENGFKSYGAGANGILSQFSSYSTDSNVITNRFGNYNPEGNGALSQFTGYADGGNGARNEFQTYDDGGNAGGEIFRGYGEGTKREKSSFRSYGPTGNGNGFVFDNYGNSSNPSTEFAEYGNESNSATAMFTSYAKENTTFQAYHETTTTFGSYLNASSTTQSAAGNMAEPGKFFRESVLVSQNQIPVPDVRDKMPPRSFLPRTIADKLPFSSERLPELIKSLNASGLQVSMAKTVADCERPAVKDETKRCVTSIEGMAEFATSVLGNKARVTTTANTVGSGRLVRVGSVQGRNGGSVTRDVSCHQSLFPYLVYYCHAVPRVKVYDVELLLEGKRANEAVAICHLDTTQWSARHAAFRALGHGPGLIEVCHFIFQNDFIWVARD